MATHNGPPHRAPSHPALATYRWLARVLQERSLGRPIRGSRAPEWADPEFVESLTLRLPRTAGSSPDTTIDVALRDGFGRRLLPPRVAIPGSDAEIALNPIRAARPIAQAALGIIRDEQPRISGTATCLVRDRLNPARNYLLTCGHVAAPDARARAGNSATIIDGDNEHTGYLAEWQPALGGQVYRTAIDAALIELKQTTATFLQRARGPIAGESLPVAVGSRPLFDKAVSVRRTSGPLPGALKIYWSGLMDMADLTPGYPDYFLNDGIGYAASENTIAGDSECGQPI